MGLLDFLNNYRTKQEQPKQEPININGFPVQVIEVGTTGTEIYSGYINEEYLSELHGKQWADKIDMMRRSDPNVKMVLNALKSPIKSANWIVQTHDDSELAQMQKKLIEKALFEDINKSFTKLIGECLTFVDFGFSVFEVTHQNKIDDPELGSYTTLRSISWRSQRTIEKWNVDKDGSLKSVTQISNGDLGIMVDLDSRFLLHFAPDQEGDNYEGVSVLRSMYGNWLRKNSFLKLLAAGIEKYAIPTPVMKVPDGARGKPEYTAAEKALKCYVSNQANYLMIPNGWELSFNNVSFDSQRIRETIDFENKEMVNAILASFLLLGQNGAGSLALSGTLSDFFAQTITYLSDHIAEQFQRKIITPLIKMNFGDVPSLVEIKCDSLEDKIDASWASMVQSLSSSGLIKSDSELEKYVREKLKLPEIIEAQEQIELPEQTDQPEGQPAIEAQSENVQQSVLNGAQVASMVQIVQSVASGMLPRESGVEIIKTAFNLDAQNAERLLGTAGRGFKIEQPEQPKTFSELSAPQPTKAGEGVAKQKVTLSLAEKKKTKRRQDQLGTASLIRDSAKELKEASTVYLKTIASKYLYGIISKKRALPESKVYNAPNETSIGTNDDYKNLLTYLYLKITANAKTEFKNLVLNKKKTLSEFRLSMSRGQRLKLYDKELKELMGEIDEALGSYLRSGSAGDYSDLLVLRNKVSELSAKASATLIDDYDIAFDEVQRAKAKVETITASQLADIQKASDLQYQSSVTISDISDKELFSDMNEATDKMIDNNIAKGADIQTSQLVNEARFDAADDIADETDDEIVSWTYIAVDDERTTDVCRELNGWTFADNDPNRDRYTPPLHWNCRSYMQVNLKSFIDNPPIDKGSPKLSDKAEGQINLSECASCGIRFAEYDGRNVELDKPFRTPDAEKKFGVYVKNENDNVVLVRFGDPDMDIKRDDLERRKSFRARHQCDTKPANKWEPRYWSCKFWSNESVGELLSELKLGGEGSGCRGDKCGRPKGSGKGKQEKQKPAKDTGSSLQVGAPVLPAGERTNNFDSSIYKGTIPQEILTKAGSALTENEVKYATNVFKSEARIISDRQDEVISNLRAIGVDVEEFKIRDKESGSLTRKMNEKWKDKTLDQVTDGIGSRFIVKNQEQADKLVENIEMVSGWKILEHDNKTQDKNRTGYRAHHLLVRTPNGAIMEIQVKTKAQDEVSRWSHDQIYKTKDGSKPLKEFAGVKEYAIAVSDYVANPVGAPPKPPKAIVQANKVFKFERD